MSGVEDWLQDPLMENRDYRKLRSRNKEQHKRWRVFHYATIVKLGGANFFCTKVIDTARTPDDLQLRWYLDAFFFELMAAYDTLLQELNVVYSFDLDIEKVSWRTMKDKLAKSKLPNELVKYVEEEREKDWFCEVQWCRNTTTHHYYLPTSRSKIWWGHDSLHSTYHAGLQYIDKEDKIKIEEISICKDYLSNMVNYISSVWGKMAQEFD